MLLKGLAAHSVHEREAVPGKVSDGKSTGQVILPAAMMDGCAWRQ